MIQDLENGKVTFLYYDLFWGCNRLQLCSFTYVHLCDSSVHRGPVSLDSVIVGEKKICDILNASLVIIVIFLRGWGNCGCI